MSLDYNILLVFLIWFFFFKSYKYFYLKNSRFPINDACFMWLFALVIYGTIPFLSWYFQGQKFSLLNGRLFLIDPEIKNIRYFLHHVLFFMAGFMIANLLLYKNVNYFNSQVLAEKIPQPIIFLSTLIFISIFFFELFFTNLISLESSSTRAEGYAIINSLPVGIRQIFKLISIFKNFTTIILIIYVFHSWPRYKSLLITYIIYLVFITIISGARSTLLLSSITMLICYHVLVKEINTSRFIFFGLTSFLFFTLVGIFRQGNILDLSQFGGFGEFSNIWANAFEVQKANQSMPFRVRFNDFFAYVPSQILWFEKESPSIWFLKTFYPNYVQSGQGLAFGIFAEAILGYGIFEALIRGGLIAFFIFIILRTITKSNYWWSFPINIYLVVNIFQSIRDTSFRFLNDTFQEMIIPTLIIITLQNIILSIKYQNKITNID